MSLTPTAQHFLLPGQSESLTQGGPNALKSCLAINQCFKTVALLQTIPFITASVKDIFCSGIKSNTST